MPEQTFLDTHGKTIIWSVVALVAISLVVTGIVFLAIPSEIKSVTSSPSSGPSPSLNAQRLAVERAQAQARAMAEQQRLLAESPMRAHVSESGVDYSMATPELASRRRALNNNLSRRTRDTFTRTELGGPENQNLGIGLRPASGDPRIYKYTKDLDPLAKNDRSMSELYPSMKNRKPATTHAEAINNRFTIEAVRAARKERNRNTFETDKLNWSALGARKNPRRFHYWFRHEVNKYKKNPKLIEDVRNRHGENEHQEHIYEVAMAELAEERRAHA